MADKILVVDDEKEIADLVALYLENENYQVFKYYNGMDALRCIEQEDLDLAILDIMLPDISGLTLCRKIREKYTQEHAAADEDVIVHSGLVLNARTHECFLNEKPLSLTPTEFSILLILCRSKGEVVSSEELFHQIWKDEYYSKNNNTITVHIRHLRAKMGDSFEHPKYIKTVWGCGGFCIRPRTGLASGKAYIDPSAFGSDPAVASVPAYCHQSLRTMEPKEPY